ncbi:hypothetical protein K440DRAFT_643334 [Wilcoxina mikolae CBS 423.85]|nr:hypothetical protein K440DRAFT_643334 [Wilcoxina mikolae CBS 423.85]
MYELPNLYHFLETPAGPAPSLLTADFLALMDTLDEPQLEELIRNIIWKKLLLHRALDKHEQKIRDINGELRRLDTEKVALQSALNARGPNDPVLNNEIMEWKMLLRNARESMQRVEGFIKNIRREASALKQQEKRVAEEIWYRAYVDRARAYFDGPERSYFESHP